MAALRTSDGRAHSGRPERLSPLDVSNLRAEDLGLPMHVAALAVLEGGPLLDEAGRLRLGQLRGGVERRLALAPRLRQVIYRPRFGLGRPLWADDPGFDITRHVLTRPVPPPGDEASLLRVCAELNEPPLDRGHPLWELWLLPGLAGGNVGMLIRLHHAVADGMAALALLGVLFGPAPDGPEPSGRAGSPPPGSWALLASAMRDRSAAVARAAARARRPGELAHRARAIAGQLRRAAREGRAPRVSLNQPVGSRRRLLLARADLGRARAVAHAHGATVNDVVLTAVAGGAGRLLAARGELRAGLVLKVSVAASNRPGGAGREGGNMAGIMLVPLPVSRGDPLRALPLIAHVTAERKRQPPYQPSARVAQRWMVRAMFRQRMVNLFTSNLPGPPLPMSFAGARVLEVFQAGVVQGNVTLAVAVLSYAGQLNFTVVADAGANPDLPEFAAGLTDALQRMGVAAAAPPAA